ncbi:Ion transport domain [Phytophthora cactorum]|nr:Ion transport domain [Phytophthora cactorum]
MNRSEPSRIHDFNSEGPESSLAQNARPKSTSRIYYWIFSKMHGSQVAPATDEARHRRVTHSPDSHTSPSTAVTASDRESKRRGSFTGTIPVPSYIPPRLDRLIACRPRRQWTRWKTSPTPAQAALSFGYSTRTSRTSPAGPYLDVTVLSQLQATATIHLGPPLLDPRSNEKLGWDALVMVVVLYSAIVVPVQMGFPEIQLSVTVRTIGIFTDVLFFLDVLHNFFVGYYPDDDENMIRDRRLIAKRYLTSSGNTSDTADGGDSISNAQVLSLRLTRLVRLLRITKLTRLVKLRHFVTKVEDAFDLDAVLARLTRLIGQVLLVTHIFSCFWHLIGFTTEDEGITWMIEADVRDKSVSERYVYSFYWVVATLCGWATEMSRNQ